MKQLHMVTAGTYDGYHVVRVYEVQGDAEQFALEYNATTPWTHEEEKARVEQVDFVPARHDLKPIEVVG